jgi:hypothetical protein
MVADENAGVGVSSTQRLPCVKQHGLVVIANIAPDQEEPLRGVLADTDRNPFFQRITTVHYAAFVILPPVDGLPSRLVLETNYDGDREKHLDDLIRLGGDELDAVYRHCKGYPTGGTPEQKKTYLKCHSYESSAFFVALPGRSVEDIQNAIRVYHAARQFLDLQRQPPGSGGGNAANVWNALVEHFGTVRGPNRPMLSCTTQSRLRWRVALFLPLLIALGILVLLLLIILLPVLRHYEKKAARLPIRPHWPEDIYDRYAGLNRGQQNHICTVATVRDDRFHRIMLRIALSLAWILAKTFLILGTLDTIKTIHFARWTTIDDGKRLLFLSNYDGAWSSYLNEFEDPPHLNAIWSNTENFPPTKFILWAGARDAARFEDHFISEFHPAQVFYTAYGEYSVQNLLRYVNLRDALAREIGP